MKVGKKYRWISKNEYTQLKKNKILRKEVYKMENKVTPIKLHPTNDTNWDTKNDSLLRGSTDPIDTDTIEVTFKVMELDKIDGNKRSVSKINIACCEMEMIHLN